MRKEFETIAQYKEQMRALLDKAEAEKEHSTQARKSSLSS